jgi:hypothetical protein
MDNASRVAGLAPEKYQAVFGVAKDTFERMLAILDDAYREMRRRGGPKRKLTVLDMLVVFFAYYRDYRTMENIGFDYGVHKQRVCAAGAWVERTLVKSGAFALPSKRALAKDDAGISIVIVDATECETERPKKNRPNRTPASRNATPSRTRS